MADLEGAEPPPPHNLRRTDAVTVLLISENGTLIPVLWRALNFDRSTVEHALHNTQNDLLSPTVKHTGQQLGGELCEIVDILIVFLL